MGDAYKFLGAAIDKENSYSEWSTCSKTCGGGTQTRTNSCALVTTGFSQSCNTQSCCSYAANQQVFGVETAGGYSDGVRDGTRLEIPDTVKIKIKS